MASAKFRVVGLLEAPCHAPCLANGLKPKGSNRSLNLIRAKEGLCKKGRTRGCRQALTGGLVLSRKIRSTGQTS